MTPPCAQGPWSTPCAPPRARPTDEVLPLSMASRVPFTSIRRLSGALAGTLGAYGLAHTGNATGPAVATQRNLNACKPIVVCGPSGVGKGTLIEKLLQEFPGDYGFSASHTTRDPRPGWWWLYFLSERTRSYLRRPKMEPALSAMYAFSSRFSCSIFLFV